MFVYREGRTWHEVRAADLNSYLREGSGRDITAKDFRTWHATVLAAVALAVSARTADGPRRKDWASMGCRDTPAPTPPPSPRLSPVPPGTRQPARGNGGVP